MANNRMQIYCKKCLEMKPIAKYYPTEWYCQNADENPINDFLTKHSESCWKNDENADHLGGEGMFGFRTENDEDKDGFISDYRKEPYKLIKESHP